MIRRLLLLGILLIQGFALMGHPVHVTVINIQLEGALLTVKVNTFVDDWETAYFHFTGKPIRFTEAAQFESGWAANYFEDSFQLYKDGSDEELELVKDTLFLEDHSILMEYHCKLADIPESLTIHTKLLTDVFYDQSNMVIFSMKGREKGLKFDFKNKAETLTLW